MNIQYKVIIEYEIIEIINSAALRADAVNQQLIMVGEYMILS